MLTLLYFLDFFLFPSLVLSLTYLNMTSNVLLLADVVFIVTAGDAYKFVL